MTIKNYTNTCKRIAKLVSASPAKDGYQDIIVNTKGGTVPNGYITETIPSVPNEVVEKMLGMDEIEFTVTYEARDTSYPKPNQALYFYSAQIKERGTGKVVAECSGVMESATIKTSSDYSAFLELVKNNDISKLRKVTGYLAEVNYNIVALSRIHN